MLLLGWPQPISFVKHEITLSNILTDESVICALGKLTLLEIQCWKYTFSTLRGETRGKQADDEFRELPLMSLFQCQLFTYKTNNLTAAAVSAKQAGSLLNQFQPRNEQIKKKKNEQRHMKGEVIHGDQTLHQITSSRNRRGWRGKREQR